MAMGILVVPTEKRSLKGFNRLRQKVSQRHPHSHGKEDPQGQIAVERG